MTATTRRILTSLVAAALLAVLISAPAGASGSGGSEETSLDLLEEVESAAAGALSGAGLAEPVEDDDSEGHETEDPDESDHAGAAIVTAEVAGQEIVVGSTRTEVADDGTSSGDITLLAIAGEEIAAAHSDSEGKGEDSAEGSQNVCVANNLVCAGLLHAFTSSERGEESSSAESDSALAFLCVGGTQTTVEGNCDGEIGAGVAKSFSSTERSPETSQSTGRSELTDVCLGGETEGVCNGGGISVLYSESKSTSTDGTGSTQRNSYLLALELAGERHVIVADPTDLSVPPGCPEGGSLACVYLNQGETYAYTGGAGSKQEALHVDVPLLQIAFHLGTTESVATSERILGTTTACLCVGNRPPTVLPGRLPITGGAPFGLIAIALSLAAVGLLVINARRGAAARRAA